MILNKGNEPERLVLRRAKKLLPGAKPAHPSKMCALRVCVACVGRGIKGGQHLLTMV